MKKIKIPESDVQNSHIEFYFEKNLIIVGANGAGKTRFGSKIEQINTPTKRISAQRYLQLNEIIQKKDYKSAKLELSNAYKNKNPIEPQNDYQHVLISLFAEESRRNADYVRVSRPAKSKIKVPKSIKESVEEIWSFVFPYRELRLEDDRVRAMSDKEEFSGSEMSDGEKIGLYLISQILLADENCTFIIDEPELHLHKALMVRLWNKLEERRSDCTFVYITHDLDFAVNKPSSKILWIQGYKTNTWKWKVLDQNNVIPEDLFLEVLGSRIPILFVEGDKGSLDVQVYQSFYENFTVIPCGSCNKVIEAVKGLKDHEDLHTKGVFGLIDRDFRPSEQLDNLEKSGIYNTAVNKIENLFLVPELIDIVCQHLSKVDAKVKVQSKVKDLFEDKKEKIKLKAAQYKIINDLNTSIPLITDEITLQELMNETPRIIKNAYNAVELPSSSDDYISILKFYPQKGLVKLVQGEIDLTNDGYKDLVLGLLTSDKRSNIIASLAKYLPNINK